jgi:phasin family protein
MEAQISFLNDMTKSLFRSFQQIAELNMRLTQTIMEESTIAGQGLLTAGKPTDIFSAAALRVQPAAEKLRAYRQHLARVAADTQVELTRVAEQHVPNASRTAETLAGEVARAAAADSEKSLRNQEETVRKFVDPFAQASKRGGQERDRAVGDKGNEMRAGVTPQGGERSSAQSSPRADASGDGVKAGGATSDAPGSPKAGGSSPR